MTEGRKPKPHSLLIKKCELNIKEIEETIADRDRKRSKPFISWMKKRQNPKMWEEWGKSIDDLRDFVKSEKERKRVLEIELEEFKRVGADKVTNEYIEKYQKEFNVDYETAKVKVLAMREEIENKKKV